MEQTESPFHRQFSGITDILINLVAFHVRKKMYRLFVKSFGLPKSVVDVGATSESVAPEANYFEEFFPYKDRITALGIENAEHLERRYPGLRFIKVSETEPWPFANDSYEVVFCNAVLEHIIGANNQRLFLTEVLRSAPKIYLTVPYRWFPIEHHTGMPLIHWLPNSMFFKILKFFKRDQFYNSQNLSFFSKTRLQKLFKEQNLPFKIIPVRFLIFTTNLVVIIDRTKS